MQAVPFPFEGKFSPELVQQLAVQISGALEPFELDSFSIGCSFPNGLSEDEKSLLKREFQFGLVKELEALLQKPADFEKPTVIITIDLNACWFSCWINPVMVEGRYQKFSREIAQTVYYCPKCKGSGCRNCKGKGRMGLESVEELAGNPAQKLFEAGSFAFHGAGREDVDVRMLGNGRRFVLEMVAPRKRTVDLQKLELAINDSAQGKISVHELKFVEKKRVGELKEERHFKRYGCIIGCEKPFPFSKLEKLLDKEILVQQQTPQRVALRRADMVRPRKITLLSVQKVSSTEFELTVLAEAGLYIKEFASGDGERTKPSLSSLLGVPCVCRQLDVLEIIEKGENS